MSLKSASPRSFSRLLCLFLALSSLSLQAQSLIDNPGFGMDLGGWILGAPAPVWDEFDIENSASSGSALLTNERSDAMSEVVALAQCLDLPLPTQLEFGISGYIPAGQSTGGALVVRFDQYRDLGCTGGIGGTTGFFVVKSDAPDTWTGILRGRSLLQSVDSVRFEVGIRKDAAGGRFIAYVDAAVLQVEELVFANGFE